VNPPTWRTLKRLVEHFYFAQSLPVQMTKPLINPVRAVLPDFTGTTHVALMPTARFNYPEYSRKRKETDSEAEERHDFEIEEAYFQYMDAEPQMAIKRIYRALRDQERYWLRDDPALLTDAYRTFVRDLTPQKIAYWSRRGHDASRAFFTETSLNTAPLESGSTNAPGSIQKIRLEGNSLT
jgi:hypothetical protein